MKREEFQTQIKFPLLLDGATGSNLMAAGMPRGVCTEIWVRDHKDVFLRLQKAYIEAGSQVIYAPTFGGNRISLSMHGLENEIEALNKTLVSYSLEAADDKVLVAGDLTTTGKMMAPAGELSYEQAFEVYQEQIHYLAEAGIDLLAVETMISIEETLAALDAALSVCDLPVMCSMTIESDGSLFTGGNIFEAALALESAGASAVGINCSVGPEQLVAIIRTLYETVSIPVIAKPNAGMPVIDDLGQAVYNMTPQDFALHMKTLVDMGASIVGGCCGTTPEFIRRMAEIL
ncbi:Methionine synthase [Blautia hydrogenotrophica]|uniref:homocysteine S-methyltransferase family protein n=1 Tax=Blautia hydrogenotrophica TaxID=53443 RepID=UPI0006C03972|nr:homocysteine S-methyltransferase family protein [Blautia hydrogenotrophica]CUM72503.1 Methionine synthase [Blautia hydrogenotrophica]SCI13309.1 Methionine synthase [uncultured Blautia sp.]